MSVIVEPGGIPVPETPIPILSKNVVSITISLAFKLQIFVNESSCSLIPII